MVNKAIKYRLYPSYEQAVLFAKTFGCCRKVYNLMLSDQIKSLESTGHLAELTPAMYKQEYPYLKEVDSLALANRQLDLQKAFRNCFSRTRKKKNGFPKYKSAKRSRKSYTTNNQKGTVAVTENSIRLPKVGYVKAVIHRKPEDGWILKSATVSKDPDGRYYASVLFEYEPADQEYACDPDNAVGLDYASNGLYVDSEGNRGSNHKYYRESQEKLAKAQRVLSRRTGSKKNEPKSKNYLKQQIIVNRIHSHIVNQRRDHLHKLSTEIANQYDTVCVENLDLHSISRKGHGFGKATHDNGYRMFLDMLEYKLADRNKQFVRVDRWYPSSQICHCCGYRNSELKDLKIRSWDCPECGARHDRDVNAAVNILQEGLRLLKAKT